MDKTFKKERNETAPLFTICNSRDAYLWRSKNSRLSISHDTPPRFKCQQPHHPPPPHPQIDPVAMTWDLIWSQNLLSSLSWWNNLSVTAWKNVPETIQWIKKVEFWGKKNGLNFKLKLRKAQKSILSVRFVDTYKRAGDQCSILETSGPSCSKGG